VFYLGKAKFKLNDAAAAVPLLQQAAELNPDEPSIFYLLASSLRAVGRGEEAKQALRRVTELHTSSLDAEKRALRDANVVGVR
jgi:Flp pilus assembly protein TadD